MEGRGTTYVYQTWKRLGTLLAKILHGQLALKYVVSDGIIGIREHVVDLNSLLNTLVTVAFQACGCRPNHLH